MTSIRPATADDFQLLTIIGKNTFLESHGNSASATDVDRYVNENYDPDAIRSELNDSTNIYHIIFYGGQPAGFSKIMLNIAHSNILYGTTENQNVTKMERLYVLKKYYGLSLGHALLQYNIEVSKQNNQAGMWLYVWKDNMRAIRFYSKAGFRIIGSHDFKLTETHSNPNHQMLLKY